MQFRILGPLEVTDDDAVVALPGAKQRALLAILLLNANEIVSSDRLIDELWAGKAPESGRTALQVRVSQLRKALGRAGEAIETRAPGYVLRLAPGELDLHRFEHLVAQADAAADQPALAATKLREALTLWRGPALSDLAYESFAQPAIRRLSELRQAALQKRIDADLALGRHGTLVGELQGLIHAYPLQERLRAQLMLSLYRSGRQADALATYRQTRRTFLDELGIEPSPSLRELEQAILRQDPSLDSVPASGPDRSLLLLALSEPALESLLVLGAALAREPGRELVMVRIAEDGSQLATQAAAINESCRQLLATGIASRGAAFTSRDPSRDVTRIAAELDCDLLLLEAPEDLLDSALLNSVMAGAACDVAALAGPAPVPGPVLVPFVGAEHDWTAIELGAWLAGAWDVPLRVAGPSREGSDASRLLATASLAIQQVHRVAAEPLLLAPGPDHLLEASEQAAVVILGLPDRWQSRGLGRTRAALAGMRRTPVLLVRRGLRPGGLAPSQSRTRFTWSLSPRAA
jgi:DNA-binding SARP family transcriptional activator